MKNVRMTLKLEVQTKTETGTQVDMIEDYREVDTLNETNPELLNLLGDLKELLKVGGEA